jgi:deoxyribodipyrimidine photo-lyase
MLPGKRNQEFNESFARVRWRSNQKNFKRWCEGTTGVPFVDAGMRQLRETGFMHNRLRMITASFLVKNLKIDWREGERYFASQLIDYDPSSNNGGWQWVAGTGADAAPYFRVFNPWTQALRFDKDALYIKRYVPELRKFTATQIHNHQRTSLRNYPKPMISHDSKEIVRWYSSFKEKKFV